MIVPLPDVLCGIGLVTMALSLPLVAGRVPMNRLYGIRVPKAFASTQNWYAVNACGGRWLAAYGAAQLAAGLLARMFAPPPSSPWSPLLLVPLLLIIPVVHRINAFARTLPG